MTVFFVLLLAVSLAALTGLVAGAVFLLTQAPSLRPRRAQLLRATVGAAAGCFAGAIVGFATVVALGLLICRGVTTGPVTATCEGVADLAPWILLGSLPLGLVAGCLVGWSGHRPGDALRGGGHARAAR